MSTSPPLPTSELGRRLGALDDEARIMAVPRSQGCGGSSGRVMKAEG